MNQPPDTGPEATSRSEPTSPAGAGPASGPAAGPDTAPDSPPGGVHDIGSGGAHEDGPGAPYDGGSDSAHDGALGPVRHSASGASAGTRAGTRAGKEAGTRAGNPSVDQVIVTQGLTKRFRGGQLAVDGLDLAVPRGSVFGFLGPNGSGKTTTIRMLMGLIEPTSGSARLLGSPVPRGLRRVLPEVGALIEGPALYGFLSGRDNLRRYDAADPTADPRTRTARIGDALERVGLAAAAGKKARAYSLGMKQRLGLAAALLQPRQLLVLDEPTNGLDPQGMREIRSLVRELAADGTTVFLSSHLLDEIEQVCTHAAVMTRGRLVVQGPVAELSAGARGRLAVTTPDRADAVRVLKEHGVTDLAVAGEKVTGELPVPPPDLAVLNAALVRADVRVRAFGAERASLEDAFVALTGEGFDVAQ